MRRPQGLSPQQRRFATPVAAYRSGLEEKLAEQIKTAGHKVRFETFKLAYTIPESQHSYTPDLTLDNGIVIEAKGLLSTEDRKKMKLVKAQHPGLDIRFVFSNANARIAKKSPTSYGQWATTNGFPFAHRTIPEAWLKEEGGARLTNMRSLGFV